VGEVERRGRGGVKRERGYLIIQNVLATSRRVGSRSFVGACRSTTRILCKRISIPYFKIRYLLKSINKNNK
jgi:hypothetical protein